jgi:hypothetical protein
VRSVVVGFILAALAMGWCALLQELVSGMQHVDLWLTPRYTRLHLANTPHWPEWNTSVLQKRVDISIEDRYLMISFGVTGEPWRFLNVRDSLSGSTE